MHLETRRSFTQRRQVLSSLLTLANKGRMRLFLRRLNVSGAHDRCREFLLDKSGEAGGRRLSAQS